MDDPVKRKKKAPVVSSDDAADILADRGQPWNDPSLKPKDPPPKYDAAADKPKSEGKPYEFKVPDPEADAKKLEKRNRTVAKGAGWLSDAWSRW